MIDMVTAFRERGVKYFYYLTHINNLHGILAEGILSRNILCARGLPFEDISDANAQRKRAFCILPEQDKLVVRDCVPLFLDYRNAMFEGLKKKLHEKLAFLVVSLEVAGHPLVCFTDRSIAYGHGHNFYTKAEDVKTLRLLDVREPEGKSIGGVPEVLIPHCVEVAYIKQICHSPKLSRRTLPRLPTGISYHTY